MYDDGSLARYIDDKPAKDSFGKYAGGAGDEPEPAGDGLQRYLEDAPADGLARYLDKPQEGISRYLD